MHDQDWLKRLKPGDEVCIQRGGWSNDMEIAPVERTTKTLVVVRGTKFSKKTGFEPGSYRNSLFITEPTEEVRREAEDRMRRRKAIGAIRRANLTSAYVLDGMATERLERIAQVLLEEPE